MLLLKAVAVTISILTSGAGSAAIGAVAGSLKGTLVGTLSSAAISSLTAQIATQLTLGVMANRSPQEMLDQVLNKNTLKSLVTSTLSAGAMQGVQGLQAGAEISSAFRKLEQATAQAGVGVGTDLAWGGCNLGETLGRAGVQIGGQVGSGMVAEQIGLEFANSSEACDRVAHKWMHGVSAAVFAGLGAAALGDDVEAAALGAAAGAMTAEVVAEMLAQPLTQEVSEEVKKQEAESGKILTLDEKRAIFDFKLSGITQIATLTGSLSGVLTGGSDGVSAAKSAANTAIDNNFWQSAVPLLWAAYTAYEWESTNVEMEDGILSDPTLENVLLPGAGSAARKTVRGGQHVASKCRISTSGTG